MDGDSVGIVLFGDNPYDVMEILNFTSAEGNDQFYTKTRGNGPLYVVFATELGLGWLVDTDSTGLGCLVLDEDGEFVGGFGLDVVEVDFFWVDVQDFGRGLGFWG